jgi:hypothetical protein
LRKTGGPLIPKGTQCMVQIRRRDGRLWVSVQGFDHRHLNAEDLTNFIP